MKKHSTLVIGHSGLSGVDCMPWESDKVPNIVDYEICIVDITTLHAETLGSIGYETLKAIRLLLCRFVASDGHLYIFYDKRLTSKNRTNIEWCPIAFSVHEESGNSLNLLSSSFGSYLSKVTSWERFLTNHEYTLELKNAVRIETTDDIRTLPESHLVNRESRPLAQTFRFGVFHQRMSNGFHPRPFYQDTADLVRGCITFLPKLPNFDSGESIRVFLKETFSIGQTTALPNWVSQIALPGLAGIDTEIKGCETKIAELTNQILGAKSKREIIVSYIKLIYASGAELEEAVALALTELGAKVIPAKYSQEEYVVTWKGQEYLFEVKGVSKSIALSHVRQLVDYMLKYQEDTGKVCKAVLYGNAWRGLAPAARGAKSDEPIFPPNVIEMANRQHVCLLSSVEFFNAYMQFKGGSRSGESILDAIFAGGGVVTI